MTTVGKGVGSSFGLFGLKPKGMHNRSRSSSRKLIVKPIKNGLEADEEPPINLHAILGKFLDAAKGKKHKEAVAEQEFKQAHDRAKTMSPKGQAPSIPFDVEGDKRERAQTE